LSSTDELLIAEQAFVEGDLQHAVKHLAVVVLEDARRPDARDLFSKIIAAAGDPFALVPLGDDNYAGTVALHALLCARSGNATKAATLLLQCVTAAPQSELLAWLQEWVSTPRFVAALEIDEVAIALHRFVFAIEIRDRYVELCDAVESLRMHHPRHERLGYVHKGIEQRFTQLPILEAHALAARISGDSAVAYSWAYAQALEGMAGTEVPTRAAWLRALCLELERLANHLGDLGALGNDAGFVCAPGDAAALSGHMRTLHDRALRLRLGANARNAVLPLTSAAMTERLIALYRDLLSL